MVLTIEDDEDEVVAQMADEDEYTSNERRTPEADQQHTGSYTNYGAQQRAIPTVSKIAANDNERTAGRKLCIKGKCRSQAAKNLKNTGNPVYDTGKKIDRYSRVIFPLGFVVFNFGYWIYYIEQTEVPTHEF